MATPGYLTLDGPTVGYHFQIRGLTVARVAELARLDVHTIYRMTNGERVQLVSVQKVARMLNGIEPDPSLAQFVTKDSPSPEVP